MRPATLCFACGRRRAARIRTSIFGVLSAGCKQDHRMSEPSRDAVLAPLEAILSDIESALHAEFWYLAVAVTLSIPDICSLLERDAKTEGWAKEEKYVTWYNENVGEKFPLVNGQACYYLRGGVVHKGQFRHAKLEYDRIVFSVMKETRARVTVRYVNSPRLPVLIVDLEGFCMSVITAAREWGQRKKDDPIVRQNLADLVRFRPEGFPPALVNVPMVG